jgi:hypothetical protein
MHTELLDERTNVSSCSVVRDLAAGMLNVLFDLSVVNALKRILLVIQCEKKKGSGLF